MAFIKHCVRIFYLKFVSYVVISSLKRGFWASCDFHNCQTPLLTWMVRHRLITAEAHFQCQSSPIGIHGTQSGTGTGFSPST